MPNDKVISIDGELVENFQEIKQIVENKPKISLNFKVLRDNDVLNVNVVPIDFFDEKTNINTCCS